LRELHDCSSLALYWACCFALLGLNYRIIRNGWDEIASDSTYEIARFVTAQPGVLPYSPWPRALRE
jgi:hypothetical protein